MKIVFTHHIFFQFKEIHNFRLFYESDDALQYELLHFKPSPGHYIAFYVKEDMVWYRGLVRCYASPNKAEVRYFWRDFSNI